MAGAERGFALIQVLLVFAMLAVVVSRLQYEQRIQVERAYHSLFLSQAQAYLDSAEDVARVALKLDAEHSKNDHFEEDWNTPYGPLPLENNGMINLSLSDLQGRFNVNWLHPSSGNADNAAEGFKRVLIQLQLGTEIADELKDWFNKDSNALFNYGDEDPAYRPSFEPMADVTELLLLKEVDRETFNTLRPYVSALPPDTDLNINTAPAEIFMALAPFISEQDADGFVQGRGSKGYDSVDAVTNSAIVQQQNDPLWINNLTVSSHWFSLYIEVTLDDRTLKQQSQIHRTSETILVARRNQAITEANVAPGDPTQASQGGNSTGSGQLPQNIGNQPGLSGGNKD